MKVYNQLAQIPSLKKPVSLCIGVFDGVHLGHRFLLEKLKEHHGTSVLLTFANHPLDLLKKEASPPLLCTNEERTALISSTGIDLLILIPFSKDIASMTYQMFLSEIYAALCFEHLYIGEGDALGKDRAGTASALASFGRTMHFQVHSIPKLTRDNRIISTSWIRECLRNGDLMGAESLLGHKISLSIVNAGLIKPGKYLVRVLKEGENTFSEEIITIEQGKHFKPEIPSTITFLQAME
jgi:riboflavin kinase/FMN adenylyltransferase